MNSPQTQSQLVLSLFSGIGLLDKAFKEKGFCVVSAGDIILGDHHNICDFAAIQNKFDGIIAGSPCQDFSKANRDRPGENSYGYKMLKEFARIVTESQPYWALLENVPNVPNVTIPGYFHQRLDINQSWYSDVSRLRHIQFFCKEEKFLQIERTVTTLGQKFKSCALASDSRSFKELCELQGLSSDFDLPSFNVQGKKRAVGNGVPLVLGRVLANAVTLLLQTSVTDREEKYCFCGCGRVVTSQRAKYYDFSCRKRAERKRKSFKNLI